MQLTLMDEVKLLQIALKFVCLTNVFINSGMCVYKLAAVRESDRARWNYSSEHLHKQSEHESAATKTKSISNNNQKNS